MKLFYSPSNANFKLFTTFTLFLFCHLTSFSATYTCGSVEEIRTAMASVVAGDEIVILSGLYEADNVAASGTGAHFVGTADGTAENPITIRSQSVDNPATLSGDNLSSLIVLRIFGDHWIVRDLNITHAQKGLIFDHAHYGQAINCEIYNIGYEAIHIRDGSDYVLIDNCYIHHTGVTSPGFGEAIYIGSDKSAWDNYAPDVNYTIVQNCTIGPEIKAEAFDIKEGTQETIIEYNTVDATGISASNYADSFVDLKGTRTYIRYNTFYRNNAENLTKGVAGIDRGVNLSCYEHVVHDNTFYMDTPNSGNMVEAYSGVEELYACNNTRIPDGEEYGNNVLTTCFPDWYNPSGDDCPTPYGLATTDITEAAATLSWTDNNNATNYELRYQVQGSSEWTLVSDLSTNTHTLSGLVPNSNYDWEVRAICEELSSLFNIGTTFTTNNTDVGGGHGLAIYDDALAVEWNNHSFTGTYDLNNTNPIQVGNQSIRADYGGWGALYFKSDGVTLTDETAVQFWIKGDSDYLLRMEINDIEYEFTTTANWQHMSVDLSEFGNPTTLTKIRFQNRSADARTVYFDQIEVLNADSPPLNIAGLQEFRLQSTPQQHVNLSWTIQQTIDCLGYEIERSNHSQDWKSIGFVDNKATASSPTSYHFIDKQAALGENFYRLKMLYKDGNAEYSAIRSIRIHSDMTEISVTPNPFNDKLQLTVQHSAVAPVSVLIFNANGQLIQQTEHESTVDNSQNLELDMSAFASGIYYATIRCGGQFFYKKLVKM